MKSDLEKESGGPRSGWLERVAALTRDSQGSLLEVELFAFTWLARVALLLAVASNWDKARWVVGRMSEVGGWSPGALAAGLEVSFAVSAYFLAARLQARAKKRDVATLWLSTIVFAAISSVANVAYFLSHALAGGAWGLVQAIALGIAAPTVALTNAILSGELAGLADGRRGQVDKARRLEQQQAHERQMAQLALEQQKALVAQERARDRRVRRELELSGLVGQAADQVTGHDGRGSGQPDQVPDDHTGQGDMSFEEFMATYQDVSGMTGTTVARLAGIAPRTGRRWLIKHAELTGNNGRGHR